MSSQMRRGARVVVDQVLVQMLELDALVGISGPFRLEGRRLHQHDMIERSGSRLCPGTDAMPDGTALHEDDRVMAVLPCDGRGNPTTYRAFAWRVTASKLCADRW